MVNPKRFSLTFLADFFLSQQNRAHKINLRFNNKFIKFKAYSLLDFDCLQGETISISQKYHFWTFLRDLIMVNAWDNEIDQNHKKSPIKNSRLTSARTALELFELNVC